MPTIIGTDSGSQPQPESSEGPSANVVDETRRRALSSRVQALRAGLSQRGILISDLSSAHRLGLSRVEKQIAASHLDAADASLGPLETALRAMRVDSAFVKKKLDRVNAAIRRAQKRGKRTTELDSLSAAALQDYVSGRYEATNRRLNQILGKLARL